MKRATEAERKYAELLERARPQKRWCVRLLNARAPLGFVKKIRDERRLFFERYKKFFSHKKRQRFMYGQVLFGEWTAQENMRIHGASKSALLMSSCLVAESFGWTPEIEDIFAIREGNLFQD